MGVLIFLSQLQRENQAIFPSWRLKIGPTVPILSEPVEKPG